MTAVRRITGLPATKSHAALPYCAAPPAAEAAPVRACVRHLTPLSTQTSTPRDRTYRTATDLIPGALSHALRTVLYSRRAPRLLQVTAVAKVLRSRTTPTYDRGGAGASTQYLCR